jgi:hypothetical protein
MPGFSGVGLLPEGLVIEAPTCSELAGSVAEVEGFEQPAVSRLNSRNIRRRI